MNAEKIVLGMASPNKYIELSMPSILGYEKVAMAAAAMLAQQGGFLETQIEDLKMAIAEACTNAIEHGNAFDHQARVIVILTVDQDSIKVRVIDNGERPIPDLLPDRSKRSDFRGLGLYLIHRLVDKVEISNQPGRNEIQLISYLKH